jgi:hypothetical protein
MSIKEILDEDAFDPEKLFNEKHYRTMVIDRDGFSKKENTAADLIVDLLDRNISRPEIEDIYTRLKELKADRVLIEAISSAKETEDCAKIVCACWETGLDFTAYFSTFVDLACSREYSIAIEALTVLENCEGELSQETLKESIDKVTAVDDASAPIRDEVLSHLKSRLI